MRLLMLPRYERLGASSRLRSYQYIPFLERAGFDIEVSPLLADEYVRSLYEGGPRIPSVLRGYVRRIAAQLSARRFDVVWLEKEFLPWLPAWMDRMCGRAALVVDYDDALFHTYDEHPSAVVRMLLGRRIDTLMRRADLVTAGNDYLASRARSAGCSRVELLPTVVDLDRYCVGSKEARNEGAVIGWMGSPSTADYLQQVSEVIARLRARFGIRAVAVGARPDQVEGTPFEAVPWTEDSEANLVASFDIGIMPLPDAPWERGKCGYKLIQYMACGIPVVASPVGVNREIVRDGINGFLANDSPEWEGHLTRLVLDKAERTRMGLAGRARVEDWYCLQVQAPRVAGLLKSVVAGSGR